MTSVPQERSRPVEASEDNVAFLGLHFDNDFANDLPDKLRAQCPNGRVTGLFTKYETYWYFLVSRRQVVARGYCVPGPPAPAAAPASVPATATSGESGDRI
jgi:hypothetical protein